MFASRLRPTALCGLGLSTVLSVESDALAAESAQLPAVVVTATRIAQPLANVLSDVRIVDADTIRNAGAATLTELLQVHAGIEIGANGGPGQTSAVFIRGSNSNHVLVLIDGVRVNSATAGTTALENLPLAQIERVEILRGPASSLYGADAIGGVIQIFTRHAERTELKVGLGSQRTRDVAVGLGRRFGATQLDVQAGSRATRAFSATNAGAGSVFNPDDDRYRNNNLGGTLAHAWAPEQSLILRGLASVGTTHFDSGPSSDDVSRQYLTSLALESRNRVTADWNSSVRAARGTDDTKISGAFPSRFRTDQDQLGWQNDLNAWRGQIAIGLEWRRERVDADTAYTQALRHVRSAFASYAVSLDAHSVQVSVRSDDDSQLGGHETGNLSYGYQVAPAWRLSIGAGTAFKAPTFADLYFPRTDFGSPGFPFLYAGNPELRPERSRNVEAAARYQDGPLRAGLTVFSNRVRDLITAGNLPSDPSVNSVINLDRARIRGATLAAGYTATEWRISSEWTHQQAIDADTRQRLLRRARNHGTASATWMPGAWRTEVEWVASGARDDFDFTTFGRTSLGGYGLVNLQASYRLAAGLTVSTRLNNAANKTYELVRGFNTPPRTVFVALEYAAR